ncbi:MAG: Ger(x)C family spore germination protein [Clostridiales bacterium]|jgi:spore germination protein KC|nr:Ger(x)C family spore germination protein [Clostridiales bacterium]
MKIKLMIKVTTAYRFLFLFILTMILCGCTHDMSRREIDEINLIRVLGIDYDGNEYTLSALFNASGGSDPEGGAPEEEVTKGKGKTPYEAYENLKSKATKSISLGHTGYFLIGDGAAENGINLCLDFLSRDETIKMDALFFITKDTPASDFIEQGIENKQKIHEDLEAIRQKQEEMITRNDNTLVNLTNEMKQTYSSILIPYLIPEESSFLTPGYAVFDQYKLKDYLDEDTSTGINFIKNIIRNYPIYINDQVGLLISYSDTKLKTKLKDNNIEIIIQVDFESMIKEVNTEENIFNSEQLELLTQEQNKYLRNILDLAISYSKATGLDVFQIARMIEKQNIVQWQDFKSSFAESISDIKYKYVFHSKITKSFILGYDWNGNLLVKNERFVK